MRRSPIGYKSPVGTSPATHISDITALTATRFTGGYGLDQDHSFGGLPTDTFVAEAQTAGPNGFSSRKGCSFREPPDRRVADTAEWARKAASQCNTG